MASLRISSTILLVCIIRQSQSNSPTVGTYPPYLIVDEDRKINSSLFSFQIFDNDPSDIITVDPEDQITLAFVKVESSNIGKPSGDHTWNASIILIKGLDREEMSSIPLKLGIMDLQGNKITLKMNMFVQDVNDNSPEFLNLPYTWDIYENVSIGQTYAGISTKDPDYGINGTVTYSMQPKAQSDAIKKNFSATFSINNVNGVVKLSSGLDYEKNNYYQFTVYAQDGGNRTSTTMLVIRVQDVQDTPPFFTSLCYSASIDEESNDTQVCSVAAQDGDAGVPNNISYRIAERNGCQALFKIDCGGVISTAGRIDRDNGTIADNSGLCTLTIWAEEISSDNYTQNNYTLLTSTSTTVTIKVNDIDDNSPQFCQDQYVANVHENTPGVPVTLINSTKIFVHDDDQGDNSKMTITLLCRDVTSCDSFTVSPSEIQNSGMIILAVSDTATLDYETTRKVEVEIKATEKKNHSHSDTAVVTINVLDLNDNNPFFSQSTFTFQIKENCNSRTLVGIITATDNDSIEFGNITYALYGGNGRFIANPKTGEIYTNCSNCDDDFDREKNAMFYMTYTATDDNGKGRSTSTSVVVELNDDNDKAPEFIRNYSAFIAENEIKYLKSPIVKVEARDLDLPDSNNSRITYALLNASLQQNFTVDFTTGEIFLNATMDYEKLIGSQGKINVTVTAQDHGSPPKSTNTVVEIEVQDVNDNGPIFNSTRFDAKIAENATSTPDKTITVGQVFATDADGTKINSNLQYFISDGSDDKFSINPYSGSVSLQTNAKLDRETKPYYNVTIIAFDTGSPPQSANTTLYVNVTDVNDERPSFNQTVYKVAIYENNTVVKIIKNCRATDHDLNANLTYTISNVTAVDENGHDVRSSLVQGYFAIYLNHCSVYINGIPDREVAKTITLTLVVEDLNAYSPRHQTDTATLNIELIDINDNVPYFEPSVYNVSIIENALNDAQLTTIKAMDKDENRTITYSILYNEIVTQSFAIDNTTGTLRKTGPIDREVNNCTVLVICAADNGVPSLNSTVSVTVTIIDFNDNSPIFIYPLGFNATVHVAENENISSSVVQAIATDKDEYPNNNITYKIDVNGKGFEINSTTGTITVSSCLDREMQSNFLIRVYAYDNPIDPTQQRSSETTITIKIDDVNDNAPEFLNTPLIGSIQEDQSKNASIMTISAKDSDEGNNSKITFWLNDTSEYNLFKIDPESGEIKVNNTMKDKDGSYLIEITATDHGDPPLTSHALANITVLDVNLNPPEINNSQTEISVYECQKQGSIIFNFTYVDKDKGINAQAHFNMSDTSLGINLSTFKVQANGALIINQTLDASQLHKYQFQVIATDHGTPSLQSKSFPFTVNVIDINNNLPSFPNATEVWNLKENTISQQDKIVKAVDKDINSTQCYSINGSWSDYFAIGKTLGNITNRLPLDYEKVSCLNLTVHVNDCTNGNGSECENIQKEPNNRDTVTVMVIVIDIDDNPPVFLPPKQIHVGMRPEVDKDTVLELNLRSTTYIHDADSPGYGIDGWRFRNGENITLSSSLSALSIAGQKTCEDNKNHIFCVTNNGTIISNALFSENTPGHINVSVVVSDNAGNDSAIVTVYLISNDQLLVMTLNNPKEKVSQTKDNLLEQLSALFVGHKFVFDNMQDHREGDKISSKQTDLYFHIVKLDTHELLSSQEAIKLMDKRTDDKDLNKIQNEYNVISITSKQVKEQVTEKSSKTLFILIGVTVFEALIICIVTYFAASSKNKYKRKLKAANIRPDIPTEMHEKDIAVPGSNIYVKSKNPLLNTNITTSFNNDIGDDNEKIQRDDLLDENEVDYLQQQEAHYDRLEEREVRLDMYSDNSVATKEDPLTAALRLHEYHKSQESLDKLSSSSKSDRHVFDDFDSLDGTEI